MRTGQTSFLTAHRLWGPSRRVSQPCSPVPAARVCSPHKIEWTKYHSVWSQICNRRTISSKQKKKKSSVLPMQESGLRIVGILPFRQLPHDDGILAGLGESQLSKPPHTVHVVAVDVSRGERREMDRDSREAPAFHNRQKWTGDLYRCLLNYSSEDLWYSNEPLIAFWSFSEFTSHSLRAWSIPHDSIWSPFRLKSALRTSSRWPSTPPKMAMQTLVLRFHKRRAWSGRSRVGTLSDQLSPANLSCYTAPLLAERRMWWLEGWTFSSLIEFPWPK